MHLYRNSGVDIKSGDEFVQSIRTLTDRTSRPEVIGSIGSFGALIELAPLLKRYSNPVLVSSTDGVGSKLLVAQKVGKHKFVGIDLVAMCANDILAHGAEPVFFLDYLAVGKLDQKVAFEIVDGISDGCMQAGMSLVGGETAELPRIYRSNEYDLAGFAVGIVEKEKILPQNIMSGDSVIGLKSSGLHSNGFLLIIQMLEELHIDYSSMPEFSECSWGDLLLEPTKIYVKTVNQVLHMVKGIAHITGGGISGNLPRALPHGLSAVVDTSSWKIPPVFEYVSSVYNVQMLDLFGVFNCGIGMAIVVSKENTDEVLSILGAEACHIGNIIPSTDQDGTSSVVFV